MKNVYQKLNTVQVKLNAPKNQYNSFGKYNYRSCEDILEGLKPLLKEVGAAVIINDSIEIIGQNAPNVPNVYVKATATFIDMESGESVEAVAFARHSDAKKGMDDAQVTGATSSYARKYALNGLFCIDDNKDADATNTHGQDKPATKPKPTSKPKPEVSEAAFVEDEDCPF